MFLFDIQNSYSIFVEVYIVFSANIFCVYIIYK